MSMNESTKTEPATKDTNPKDAAADGRLRWDVLPVRALVGAALALSEGAHKYRRHNYRVASVRFSVYFNALLRHTFAWWEGEDIDPASGIHHIDKAIAGLLVLRDSMIGGNATDDRPPSANDGWVEIGNEWQTDLIDRMRSIYGEGLPPYTRADTGPAPPPAPPPTP